LSLLPTWMLDPAICALMSSGESLVDLGALEEIRAVLAGAKQGTLVSERRRKHHLWRRRPYLMIRPGFTQLKLLVDDECMCAESC
jgi:hypothetical protein